MRLCISNPFKYLVHDMSSTIRCKNRSRRHIAVENRADGPTIQHKRLSKETFEQTCTSPEKLMESYRKIWIETKI
ncbi:uncharacterized protein PHALS_15201 [Plasmopara halstedii]|uniref:Uncharacterized protein n=1 Tax=Plasmopara halstedii TaxID=4781 RepID=A0A0P1B658_PLAHL|nr:uncharacterized protein PHALS_15201 [Plasmopara halstedii]CEG49199.1 hypothetical protein PHALS_15201 [Plasmopara halstedii]|eukprot:XP_024585568.1 hypothetical protein PHALS_15201 [Plasmopara halstedii]